MANHDRARKLLVRSALATSATIATFIGAQNLAMLDASQLTLTPTSSANQHGETPVVTSSATHASTALPVEHAAPQLVIRHAAPSIVILRRGGQGTASSTTMTSQVPSVQVAPALAQITLPNPVIVQQPMIQMGRSSR